MRKAYVPVVLVLILGLALFGCERKITNEDSGNPDEVSCFTCHSDNNFDFIAAQQQWANSKHGSGENIDRNSSPCRDCHTSEGFIAKLAGVDPDGNHYSSITCFTCHQPHTRGDFTLRAEGPYELEDGTTFDYGKSNLCVRCHHARRDVREYVSENVTLSSHWGPHHSDQGDIIAGAGGYEYVGYNYTQSAHNGVLVDGCIDCHMTGSFTTELGGHTWRMRWDEDDEHLVGCNQEACHGITGPLTTLNRTAEQDFDGDGTIEGVQDEVKGLLEELGDLLVAEGLMEGDAEHGYHPADGVTVTDRDMAGAVYNHAVVAEERSYGVHNTDYVVGLLRSAINYVETGSPTGFPDEARTRQLVRAH